MCARTVAPRFGVGVDEALGLEHEQRLAHRRPADPELAGELLLLQPLARLQPAVDDRLADQLGRGHARVAHETSPPSSMSAPRQKYSMQSEPPTALAPDRPDYGWFVDRIAIARAERRRQAMEELEFEREREAALHEEIARLVLELEGPGLDEEVFGRLLAGGRRSRSCLAPG